MKLRSVTARGITGAVAAAMLATSATPAMADGYRGGGATLVEDFTSGNYFGEPMLHYFGMAVMPRHAAEREVAPYPHMLRWLR